MSWFVLTFVSVGSLFLLVSVGVTIYRRRHAVPVGDPVGHVATMTDLESCYEELADVEQGLERHLENFHTLLAHYNPEEAQRWAEDQSFWLGQWRAALRRCHFDQPRRGPRAKEWEELGVMHAELRETEADYTKELIRFAQKQAPRLDRIRKRLEELGERLAVASGQDTTDKAPPTARDSGEIP